MLHDSLWVLNFGLQEVNKSKPFPEAGAILQTDRIIRYINALEMPKTASTTNRVFKSVVMRDLQGCLGFNLVMKLPQEAYIIQNQ